MEKYRYSLSQFIAKRIDDVGVVEEITNDVMWAAQRGRDKFEGKSAEFSWLCAIAKNKIVDYYRKKRIKMILFSAHPLLEEIADRATSPERDVLKNEFVAEIKKTLSEIGEGYGRILRLKYIDGRKVAEIAQILSASIGAVESKLVRAKAKFRAAWAYDQTKTNKHRKTGNTDSNQANDIFE